jgi:hypothetical protein
MNANAHYGPVQDAPPVGSLVFYHGTKIDYHGVWEVVGTRAGRTVLERFREDGGETLTISEGNRTITVLAIEEAAAEMIHKVEAFLGA